MLIEQNSSILEINFENLKKKGLFLKETGFELFEKFKIMLNQELRCLMRIGISVCYLHM